MYLLELRKWNQNLAGGQDHFVVDAWFEAVSEDANPGYWPPQYSLLQLFKNFWQIIVDVEAGILKEYQVKDAAEEIHVRMGVDTWRHWTLCCSNGPGMDRCRFPIFIKQTLPAIAHGKTS